MAKKIQLNKKTLRVLSVDEIKAVAGGLEEIADTELRVPTGPRPDVVAMAPAQPDPDTTL